MSFLPQLLTHHLHRPIVVFAACTSCTPWAVFKPTQGFLQAYLLHLTPPPKTGYLPSNRESHPSYCSCATCLLYDRRHTSAVSYSLRLPCCRKLQIYYIHIHHVLSAQMVESKLRQAKRRQALHGIRSRPAVFFLFLVFSVRCPRVRRSGCSGCRGKIPQCPRPYHSPARRVRAASWPCR